MEMTNNELINFFLIVRDNGFTLHDLKSMYNKNPYQMIRGWLRYGRIKPTRKKRDLLKGYQQIYVITEKGKKYIRKKTGEII